MWHRRPGSPSTSSSSPTSSRSCSTPGCGSCSRWCPRRSAGRPLDDLRWISFGHVEADECGAMNHVPGRRADRRGGRTAAGVHGVAERPRRPPAPGHRRTRCSTSAPTACASCRRRTCRTTGRAASGSTRRPRRCSRATCSRTSATGRRWTERLRRAGDAGRVDVPRDVAAAPTSCRRCSASPTSSPTTLALMHGSSFKGDGGTSCEPSPTCTGRSTGAQS